MENKLPFSAQTLRSILESAEGQRLMHLLQRDGAVMNEAMAAYRRGDIASVKVLLAPLAQSEEAETLLHKIDGGG